jgi:hypothetical protein
MATKKDWDKLEQEAAELTNKQYAAKVSSLTSLTDTEFLALLKQSSLSKEEMTKILAIVHDATLSNEKKAKAISNISGGLSVVMGIISKLK